jgi:hypothetical protein
MTQPGWRMAAASRSASLTDYGWLDRPALGPGHRVRRSDPIADKALTGTALRAALVRPVALRVTVVILARELGDAAAVLGDPVRRDRGEPRRQDQDRATDHRDAWYLWPMPAGLAEVAHGSWAAVLVTVATGLDYGPVPCGCTATSVPNDRVRPARRARRPAGDDRGRRVVDRGCSAALVEPPGASRVPGRVYATDLKASLAGVPRIAGPARCGDPAVAGAAEVPGTGAGALGPRHFGVADRPRTEAGRHRVRRLRRPRGTAWRGYRLDGDRPAIRAGAVGVALALLADQLAAG